MLKNNNLKKWTKFGNKTASSSEESDKRTLAKLSLILRKSPRSTIFVEGESGSPSVRIISLSFTILHTMPQNLAESRESFNNRFLLPIGIALCER